MAKENVKINQVEAPTLFIGVGGTGCDVVKRVAEMCRPGETDNISFVCLDTNVNDLSNVQRSKAKIYYVQTSNTQTVGDYLSYDADARKNWFPKNAVIYDKTVSEGAGQVRAISRLALNATIKTGKIRPLYDAIDDLFRKDGRELKQALRVVMVSTSSGGTGSGIVLPLAMFLRDHINSKYPNTSLIVRSLILLPETLDSVIDSSVERDSQRRNAYATIKEINAFMMKGSGFLDVESDLKRYGNLHIDFPIAGTDDMKPLGILPFDFCFLMDGQDAEDTTLVSLNQYKQQAAQALYEQNIGPMQKNAFSVEDNIIKEMSNPGNFGRNRFGAIGASTVRYPYEKIADYIAYDWAKQSIGGDGEAAKWSRYDKEFKLKLDEARKKGLAASEGPKREEVYIQKMDQDGSRFSKDLRHTYLGNAQGRLDNYLSALTEKIKTAIEQDATIAENASGAYDASVIDFKDESNYGRATELYGYLQAFEESVRAKAEKIATGMAESIFYNEKKTAAKQEPYTLEALLKNSFGQICHPNAARYMLYMADKEFLSRHEIATSELEDLTQNFEVYGDGGDPNLFAVKYLKSKAPVRTLADMCKADKKEYSISEKMAGCKEIYGGLEEHFRNYYNLITDYIERIAEKVAFSIGHAYLEDLNKEFLAFFNTFAEKVEGIERKKDDLVNELTFRKGDSVFNVCSSKEMLEELSKNTKGVAEEGCLLDSEANGEIFDAIKQNAMFEREARVSEDTVMEDRRVDIFDDVLLGYFKKDVRRKCADKLDLNIIEAIANEKRLLLLQQKREQSEDGERVYDKVTQEEKERYIHEVIAMGQRLAAPSVQRMRNVESREIALCAYNKSLLDMRTYRITELMPKGNAVDSISKYELRFFNALYNLTPDKLNKFAAPSETETSKRKGGLYYNAYVSYARDIGPDSTKGAKISTHIDKRWDSIAVMPELDFNHQEKEMLKIHQAMIYGLVFDAIKRTKYSMYAKDKMVYKFQNSDERYVALAVSNNTPCDEFYEIADSLYISSFVVNDIEVIKAKKRYKDRMRHANYGDTEFKKALDNFRIPEICEDDANPDPDQKTSLFEIPVFYYASLPNNKRYNGEIGTIVDAVIKTFEDELILWEDKDDVKFVLCDILQEQYDLMMANYEKYPKLKNNLEAKDNPIIEIIFQKIRGVVESTPEPSDYVSMIQKMKEKIH